MIPKILIASLILAIALTACAKNANKIPETEVRKICELFKSNIMELHNLETDLSKLETDSDGSSMLAKKIKGEWLSDYGNGDDSWCFYSSTVLQEGANFAPERIRMVFRTEDQSDIAPGICEKREYCHRQNDKQHTLLWANSTKQSSPVDAQQFFYEAPVSEH